MKQPLAQRSRGGSQGLLSDKGLVTQASVRTPAAVGRALEAVPLPVSLAEPVGSGLVMAVIPVTVVPVAVMPVAVSVPTIAAMIPVTPVAVVTQAVPVFVGPIAALLVLEMAPKVLAAKSMVTVTETNTLGL